MTRSLRHALAFSALSAAAPLLAQPLAADAPPAIAVSDEAAAIADAERRGLLIYRYDQAAWHSSDALVEDVPQAERAAIRGWVVVEAGDALRTIYYGGEPGSRVAIYSADWQTGMRVENRRRLSGANQAIDAEAARLIGLRDALAPPTLRPCGDRPFNIVTVPASATGTTDSVYLLTPQIDRNIPFGGHYRIDFSEGREVSRRRFANSCLTVPAAGEMMVVSHLLGAVATEIHVFSMYAARRPVAVVIGERLWTIRPTNDGPSVRLVAQDAR